MAGGGGGVILFSLHMTMVWDLARGAGIPAPSDAIDVWMGIPSSTAGLQARGPRPPSR